jgi:hypothetical protein
MNWVIRENGTAIGVGSAADIVVGRLEYLVEKKPANPRRLLAEALDYARALRRWVHANQPPFQIRGLVTGEAGHGVDTWDGARPGGKPGPMSDG